MTISHIPHNARLSHIAVTVPVPLFSQKPQTECLFCHYSKKLCHDIQEHFFSKIRCTVENLHRLGEAQRPCDSVLEKQSA